MDSLALELSGELAEGLAANDQASADTRDIEVRLSYLKAMGKSPAHCLHAMRSGWEPSLAMRIGSGAHALLLGGQAIAVYPGKTRQGKAWETFKDEHRDDLILNRKEMRTAEAIAASVRGDSLACRVLFDQPETVYEQTIHFEFMGRKCRATPDARTYRHLVDLKSTRNAEPSKFQWDAIRMGYHAQMAFYAQAMKAERGFGPSAVYIVAVESTAPHTVTVHELTPGALSIGERLCRTWMERLKACEAANSWPGYCQTMVPFEVPDMELNLTFAEDDDSSDGNEQL